MGRKRKKYSIKFDVAKTMPPLYHTLPGQEFDNDKSQLYGWIKEQPEFLEYIRDILRQAGYIVYNPETGQWAGVDYKELNDRLPTSEELAKWERESELDGRYNKSGAGGFWLDQ